MLAFNPYPNEVTIPLPDLPRCTWRQLADCEHFFVRHEIEPALPLNGELYLPPLGCGLWIGE